MGDLWIGILACWIWLFICVVGFVALWGGLVWFDDWLCCLSAVLVVLFLLVDGVGVCCPCGLRVGCMGFLG